MSPQPTRDILPNGLSVLIALITRSPNDHPSITSSKKRVLLTIFAPGYACRASDFDLVVRRSLDDNAREADSAETATERIYVSIDFPGTGETDVGVLSSSNLDLGHGSAERVGVGTSEDGGDGTMRGEEERKKGGQPTIEGYARCLNYVRSIMYERLLAPQDRRDEEVFTAQIGENARTTTAESAIDTVLVGHSMGVRVVLEAFNQRPQGVVGLVFLDGSWYNLRGKGYVEEQRRIFREKEDQTKQQGSEGGRGEEEVASKEREQAVERLFAAMWSEHTPVEFREQAVRDAKSGAQRLASLRMSHLLWDDEKLEGALRVVKEKAIEVLVIQSTDAKGLARIPMMTGDESRWMKLVKDGVADGCYRGEVLEGLGHFPHVDGPGKRGSSAEQMGGRDIEIAGSLLAWRYEDESKSDGFQGQSAHS